MSVTFIESFSTFNGITAGDGKGLRGRWTRIDTPEVSLVPGRFGGQALRGTDVTGNSSINRAPLPSVHTDFNLRFAYKHETGIASITTFQPILQLLDSGAGPQLGVFISPTGVVKVARGLLVADLIVSPAAALVQGQWHHFELYGKIADAGSVTLRMDGNPTPIGTFAGDTQNTAIAGASLIQLHTPDGSGSSQQSLHCDIVMRNDNAAFGESKVEVWRPNADTLEKDFVPSTGVNHFAAVDDVLADTVDWLSGSVVGDYDLFGLSDPATIPTTIEAMQAILYGLKTDAASRGVKAVLEQGGVTADSVEHFLLASINSYRHIYNTAPGGGAFDPATAANIQLGVRVTT